MKKIYLHDLNMSKELEITPNEVLSLCIFSGDYQNSMVDPELIDLRLIMFRFEQILIKYLAHGRLEIKLAVPSADFIEQVVKYVQQIYTGYLQIFYCSSDQKIIVYISHSTINQIKITTDLELIGLLPQRMDFPKEDFVRGVTQEVEQEYESIYRKHIPTDLVEHVEQLLKSMVFYRYEKNHRIYVFQNADAYYKIQRYNLHVQQCINQYVGNFVEKAPALEQPQIEYLVMESQGHNQGRDFFFEMKNLRTNWMNAYAKRGEYRFYYFMVDCTGDDTDITELKYYLLLYNILKENCALYLNLSKNDVYRVIRFFAYEKKLQKTICYKNDKEECYQPISNVPVTKGEVSDIFPILTIHATPDGQICDLSWLSLLCKEYSLWITSTKRYAGTKGNEVKAPNKKQLAAEVDAILSDKMACVDWNDARAVIAHVIYLNIIRNLLEQKQLYEFRNKEYYVKTNSLNKADLDAQSYADGIFQLIENACLYSEGHFACFGMRIYNAGRMTAMGDLLESIRTRNYLYQKYSSVKCFDVEGNSQNNCFHGDTYSDYIEFYVLDIACSGNGIVPTYIHNATANQATKNVTTIREIIDLSETAYYREKTQDHSDYYTKHYGLRWFTHVVRKNKGMFHVSSPNGDSNHSVYYTGPQTIDGTIEETPSGTAFATDYNILIPLSYEYEATPTLDASKGNSQYIFGDAIDISPNPRLLSFDLFKMINLKKDKASAVDSLFKNFSDEWKSSESPAFIFVPFFKGKANESITGDSGVLSEHVEILAKALFKFIYAMHEDNDSSKCELRIAVDFGTQTQYVGEFVRIFSIFYDKMGENDYMENTQIAICTTSENENTEVNFIIAGKTIQSAYNTAKMYMYYNADSSMQYLHLLKYLTKDSVRTNEQNNRDKSKGKKKEDKDKAVSIFPFDLYLKEGLYLKEESENNTPSLFMARIDRLLNTELTSMDYGCKIPYLNIRLGSAIRLNTFYDAELLFHNVANTYRFAYMLASDIIRKAEKDKKEGKQAKVICIAGYEDYSAMMIQQIAFWVRKWANPDKDANVDRTGIKVISAVLTVAHADSDSQHTNSPRMKIDYLDSTFEGIDSESTIICHTIVPISTTMSTIWKVQKELKYYLYGRTHLNNFTEQFRVGMNYVLVLVCPKDIEERTDKIYSERFWLCSDVRSTIEASMVVNLQDRPLSMGGVKQDEKQQVTCLLVANSEWIDPDSSPSDKEERPLLGVDKTSTIPRSIFGLKQYTRKIIPDGIKSDNHNHIKNLRPKYENKDTWGLIKYAHIAKGHNHYQFYFDAAKITVCQKDKIVRWVKGITIPDDSFNIIIAPVNTANSVFVKLILDNVFTSSLRFMHLDINQTVAEEALTKFSYIFKELGELKKLNPHTQVNFYYIDDSIVTGSTLQRAKKLMRMLIDRAGIHFDEEMNQSLFRKVFFLINRCSYDTLNTIVCKPEENVHAFINLLFPSYNTNRDHCPGELVQRRYELLKKRSASVEIAANFEHLSVKHKKRSVSEYDEWLDTEIRESRAYFAWLKWYMYNAVEKKKIGGDKWKSLYDKIMGMSGGEKPPACIREFCEGIDADQKNTIFDIMKFIIDERAYVRLETLNRAYQELVYHGISIVDNDEKKNNDKKKKADNDNDDMKELTPKEFDDEICKRIYLLLLGQEPNTMADAAKEVFDCYANNYDDSERILSYIKVISREHLSNYYHVKVAIVKVMKEVLNAVIDYYANLDVDKARGERYASIDYLLCSTLIHRLAILQDPYVFSKEVYYKLVGKNSEDGIYVNMQKAIDKNLFGAEIPPKRIAFNRYVTSIKTATMMTDNDAYCNKLFEITGKADEVGEEND